MRHAQHFLRDRHGDHRIRFERRHLRARVQQRRRLGRDADDGHGGQAEREEGEAFNDCAQRIGAPRFEEEVSDLALPPEFSLETMQMFIDWKAKVPFEVIRGEGECAV